MKSLFYVSEDQTSTFILSNSLASRFEVNTFESVPSCLNALEERRSHLEEAPEVIIFDCGQDTIAYLEDVKRINRTVEDANIMLLVPAEKNELMFEIIREGIMNYVVKKGDYLETLLNRLKGQQIAA